MPGDSATEEWRVVPHLPDYEVSNIGRVRRRTPCKGRPAGTILRAEGNQAYTTVGTVAGPQRVHVLVAVAFLGPIPPGGEVHHKDEDKRNPRLDNLEVWPSRRAHKERHRKTEASLRARRHDEPNPLISCACGCGRRFRKFDRWGRPRSFVTGHNYEADAAGRYAPKRRGGEALAR